MSAVGVSESRVRPILAEAVEVARRALLDLEPVGVGVHLGVTAEDDSCATHHFAATLPGYGGWQWAVVVAAPPEADRVTVSESALLPGPDALIAPDFVPWEQRIRPGDLAPGDLLAPPLDDPRLVPGYIATGDPAVDDVALELGLGRPQVLSREGREEAADRWFGEFGPDSEMARSAPSTCGLCGFYVPLAGSLRAGFGVCANAMGADGRVVSVVYGCGAHSDVELPTGGGSPLYEAYDDAAVELIPDSELRPGRAADAESDTSAAEDDAAVEPIPDTELRPGRAADAESDATAAEDEPAAADPVVAEPRSEADTPEADAPQAASEPSQDATEATTDDAEAGDVIPSGEDVPAEVVIENDSTATDSEPAEVAAAVAIPAAVEEAAEAAETAAAENAETTTVDETAGTLFEVADPDAVYDDAWAVSSVRVEQAAGGSQPDSAAPESH